MLVPTFGSIVAETYLGMADEQLWVLSEACLRRGAGEGGQLLPEGFQLHLLLDCEVLGPSQLVAQVLALLRMPLPLEVAEAEVRLRLLWSGRICACQAWQLLVLARERAVPVSLPADLGSRLHGVSAQSATTMW